MASKSFLYLFLLYACLTYSSVQAQNSCSGIFTVFEPLSKVPAAQSFCSSKFPKAPQTSTTTVTATAVTTTTVTTHTAVTSVVPTTVTATTVVATVTTTQDYQYRRKRNEERYAAAMEKRSEGHGCLADTTTTKRTTTTSSTTCKTTSTTKSTTKSVTTTTKTTTTTTKATTTTTKAVDDPLTSLLSLISADASSACACITPPVTTNVVTATATAVSVVSATNTITDTIMATSATTVTKAVTSTVTTSCPSATPNYCNGKCVNYQTDPNNCGDCGNQCGYQDPSTKQEANICLRGGCTAPTTCRHTQHYCGQDPQSPTCACIPDTSGGNYVCAPVASTCGQLCNSDSDCPPNAYCNSQCAIFSFKGGCAPPDNTGACKPNPSLMRRSLGSWDDLLQSVDSI